MFNSDKISKNKQGFTLIEILVSISIFSVITVMFVNFMLSSFTSTTFQLEQSEAVKEARDAMSEMKVEIRGLISSEQGSYPIELIDDDEFVFYCDIDDDGDSEKVRYHRVNSILYKETTEPGALSDYSETPINTILALHVNNDDENIFTFHDSDYNITGVISDIRIVNLVLKINVTPEIAPNDIYVDTDVMFRNLKDNL